MPGGGSPANKALPDSGASPHPETIAITQGQLPHRTESPPIVLAERRFGAAVCTAPPVSMAAQIVYI
jgi:hypothetical protein